VLVGKALGETLDDHVAILDQSAKFNFGIDAFNVEVVPEFFPVDTKEVRPDTDHVMHEQSIFMWGDALRVDEVDQVAVFALCNVDQRKRVIGIKGFELDCEREFLMVHWVCLSPEISGLSAPST